MHGSLKISHLAKPISLGNNAPVKFTPPTRIGYARVSTQQQNLDRQIAALNAAGCTRIFAEKASGRSIHNPELEKAITALPSGGTLVIAEWDRATRSMLDGIAIMTRVHRMGALVKVLDRTWPWSSLATAEQEALHA